MMTEMTVDEMNRQFKTGTVFRAEDVPMSCSPSAKDMEQTLHGVMKMNGLIIKSLEEIAGRGANAVTYRAGKKFGHEVAKYFQKNEDIEEALRELSYILHGQYTFELWKPEDKEHYVVTENGETFIYLVFHDCIVRQTLRRNGM
ncbi:MAG TPA: hydrocarbon binding protein (contains V4R domain), partial [Methanofollis liminatans]|nr:hydrocarbon binding protein (contains V4R domain) [Methanofollis liminatans]